MHIPLSFCTDDSENYTRTFKNVYRGIIDKAYSVISLLTYFQPPVFNQYFVCHTIEKLRNLIRYFNAM